MALKVGTRVVRGPDWQFSDQDEGEGHLGTVVKIGKGFISPHPKIVVVCWDMGNMADYRAGFDGKYDLLVYDNAATGVRHIGVVCNECKEHDIAGIRWKCSTCYDYDLCNKCYMSSKHDLKHTFLRITIPKSAGSLMSPRASLEKTEAKGLFPGAKVCRGKDWKWQEQDGGKGNTGEVLAEATWANIPRSAAKVGWYSHGSYDYRVGHDGKVDIKCLQAGEGCAYYKDHLPKFGESESLEIGDRVVVELDEDVLKALQENHGGWQPGMEKCIGKVGRLVSLTADSAVRIKYSDGESWILNPVACTKLPSFKTGDKVRIMNNLTKVKELQEDHGGWQNLMKEALGKQGRVLNVDADGDIKVKVAEHYWTFNPHVLTLVEEGSATKGMFAQDIREGMMEHLLKILDPLGIIDPEEIREMMDEHLTESGGAVSSLQKEFFTAIVEGDVKRADEFLTKDSKLANVIVGKKTPLHIAAYKGHLQIVELLTKKGAKLDVRDDDGDTALVNAVHQDETEILQFLLDHGADPNTSNDILSLSPLHVGTAKNHVQCVKLLLDRGCNPNLRDKVGDTPLHDAIRKSRKEITKLLLNAPNIDLEIKNYKGFNALHHAALTDNPHATSLLIKKQPSLVNIPKDDGYTALHLAVLNGNRFVVEKLIIEGECDIDLYNEEHQTPLVLAVARGRTPIIEDLIKHGADINSTDGNGDSCLHIAVMKYRQGQDIPDSEALMEIRRKFSDSGINKPITALMCYLVQKGANLNQTNLKKQTPLTHIKGAAVRKVLEYIARKLEREKAGEANVDAGEDCLGEHVSNPDDETSGDEHEQDDVLNSSVSSMSDASLLGVPYIKSLEEEVTLENIIGKGAFGKVWKGKWKGTPVAVKKVSTEGSKEAEINEEVKIHTRARHPNIVKLMAVGPKGADGETMIVMELIKGSNLLDIIFVQGNPYLYQEKVHLSRDLLSAVTYLHHMKILHLDIKPQNIMVEEQTKRPYLCDLGLAHIKTRSIMSQSHLTFRGTYRYMSPEDCASEDGIMSATAASDVWSLACTFVELFTGEPIWPAKMRPTNLIFKFMGSDVMPAGVQKLDADIKKILEPCFEKSKSTRPTVESMMQQFSGLITE